MRNKKLVLAALGIGATYLMKNKGARDKLFNKMQTFIGRAKTFTKS
jgi:hypothetical protein